jgi:hypothetical protein
LSSDELGEYAVRVPSYTKRSNRDGAQLTPLSLIISTQAPTDSDLLSILIDDALADTIHG